jgi:excinuclease ABC subunit C
VRGERARFLQLAQKQRRARADGAGRQRRLAGERLASLQELLGLEAPPRRIECFDISHTMGELAVASCVVFDGEGPVRSQYRRFNIAGITPGDDYAGMRQALMRRFKRGVAEGVLPDLLLIDGGAGQLAQAREVLPSSGGRRRHGRRRQGRGARAGHETLVFPTAASCSRAWNRPGLQLIQQVRDERIASRSPAIAAGARRRARPAGSRTSPASARAGARTCSSTSAAWSG